LQTKWKTAYTAAESKNNRTEADVLAKNKARAAYEEAIRLFVKRFLTVNPKITDPDKERMGLTVPSGSHTPAPVPTTPPYGMVDFSVHRRHTLHFGKESPLKRGKPDGVMGCEIWRKIGGEAPVSDSELTFVAVDTHEPYVFDYPGEDVGKTAYYWLRWVNTRGIQGPWSTTISAIIA
jgi:hypothetical protein